MHHVIIGSGVAGVILASRLLEQDHTVEMIEAGGLIKQLDYRTWYDYVSKGPKYDPYLAHKGSKTDQTGPIQHLVVHGSRYFGSGGSTNVWGGWCVRYQPEDCYLKSNVGQGLDWPYDYTTLKPYYDKAEVSLWVAGENKPNPHLPYTLKDGVIIEALTEMGLSYEHLPLARSEDCQTIGTCKYCPLGLRYAPTFRLDELQSLYSDRFTLHLNTAAVRVEMGENDVCQGVTIKDILAGTSRVVTGDRVIITAGALESPKILLNSKSFKFPSGVGNQRGNVGRHITAHPLVRTIGLKDSNLDNFEQPVDFPTLACRSFDSREWQQDGKLFFVRDGRKNAAAVEERLISGETKDEIASSMRSHMPFELRGFIEIFSHESNFIELGEGDLGSFGLPKTKVHFTITEQAKTAIARAEAKMTEVLQQAGCKGILPKTYPTIRADHCTSTCRMAANEAEGVVDADLKVFGTSNLYVCSNAVLPNVAAVNPTLTLAAVTEKLADHLA